MTHPAFACGALSACLRCGNVTASAPFCSQFCLQQHAAAAALATFPLAYANATAQLPSSCVCCGAHTSPGEAYCCSKRCVWFSATRCPQCGRGRSPAFVYCSAVCASQARQANWCLGCGVRQIVCGSTSCGHATCATAAASTSTAVKPRSNSRRGSLICRHELLAPQDKVRQSLVSQWSFGTGGSVNILAVIKITPDAMRRKVYLAYRSTVERAMTVRPMEKYGFGGEGNEQRRYIPTYAACGFGQQMPLEYCGHITDSTETGCETCSVLQSGFSLERSRRSSHFGVATCGAAVPWCAANEHGIRAVIVARIVVGATQCVSIDVARGGVPCQPECHTTTVCDGNPANDCTYIFCDEAVDPQFLVLFA